MAFSIDPNGPWYKMCERLQAEHDEVMRLLDECAFENFVYFYPLDSIDIIADA